MMEYIAHCKQNQDGSWAADHGLLEHSKGVARLAEKSCKAFGSGDWAHLIGLWHDLGKYNPDWQVYLRRNSGRDPSAHIEGSDGRPNHSEAGAIWALEKFGKVGRILAYCIAGHHAGLPDWEGTEASLVVRLYKGIEKNVLEDKDLLKIKPIAEAMEIMDQQPPCSSPMGIKKLDEEAQEQFHLWIRMLFSALVDADFLDTEAYMQPEKVGLRGSEINLRELKNLLDLNLSSKSANASQTAVNLNRQKILQNCREAAALEPGFFSLTVPTGGGKTLSSMAFALEHAIRFDKKRVIMAIPYTSIIEQTAKVYADVFGEENVLEHHSNFDPDKETPQSRLATENWDASIVVTTNVQLFESLMAARTSSCRKLHNLVNSVIILDEAQMLPTDYYRPILSILSGLVKYFGVTVVLCTATQPALHGKIGSGMVKGQSINGLKNVREIIQDPAALAQAFSRVQIDKSLVNSPQTWECMADRIAEHRQVLVIVNTRADAKELHRLLPEGAIHLSANMCGEERSEIIEMIKARLVQGDAIKVVSTQLIEAGVDIDFPVVYRAMAGLDSIAQAAGRCNREGKLEAKGQVYVFSPPKQAPKGLLSKGENACRSVLSQLDQITLSQSEFTQYFKQFYANLNDFDVACFDDKMVKSVQDFKFQFRTFAQKVQLISSEGQKSVIVQFEDKKQRNSKLLQTLKNWGPSRDLSRKLQRFSVNISGKYHKHLCAIGAIENIHDLDVLDSRFYQKGIGVVYDESALDIEGFIL